ncbi:hypothetical protein [Cellulomonas composti]|uniref:Uncharacterized protein n=1 Tax=Cellulomonas composti TaxID=266130 RepID=A0A511JAM2_9CELL|nr:hypothetical protein [Cellulomonas composti]GEL95014.1 hypothetical protein CCO02nite_16720 [Cellulomonas composti]
MGAALLVVLAVLVVLAPVDELDVLEDEDELLDESADVLDAAGSDEDGVPVDVPDFAPARASLR